MPKCDWRWFFRTTEENIPSFIDLIDDQFLKTSPFFIPNDPPNLRELNEKDVMNVPFYKKSDSEVRHIKLPVARKSIIFCLSCVS
jgi:hypothetical protein